MEFPIEEARHIISIAQSAIDLINRLRGQLNPSGNAEKGEQEENEDKAENIKRAISILTQETQAKKSVHVEQFVENTILDPECELEDATIFSFLKDIEQMTWRQLCLLEGFRKKESKTIEINRFDDSGIDGMVRENEIKILIDLNYLNNYGDYGKFSDAFKDLYVTELGAEISKLLVLEAVELPEIGKAFGKGKVRQIVQY